MLFTGCSLQNKQARRGHSCSPAAPGRGPGRGSSPLPPGELLPDPELRNHLPSEDLLRDLAQLPAVGGKGTAGPGSRGTSERAEGEARRRYTD